MNKRMIDSEYYIRTWNFDPLHYQIELSQNPDQFRYEQNFPLSNDTVFSKTDLVFSARVDVYGEEITNYIVIKNKTNEITIKCRHTILFQGSWNEIQQIGMEKFQDSLLNKYDTILSKDPSNPQTTNNKHNVRPSVHLSPEEHFVALRIYVDQVSKLDYCLELERVFQDGLKTYPLRKKILAGLIQIAPEEMKQVAKSILQSWGFIPKYLLDKEKDDIFEAIRCFLMDDPEN
jgi:hypothetical protein